MAVSRAVLLVAALSAAFVVASAQKAPPAPAPAPGAGVPCDRPVPSNNAFQIDCGGTDGQWEFDEFECSFGNYELNCEYDTKDGKPVADCELDPKGPSTAYDFACPIVDGKVACDYRALTLPPETADQVKYLFNTWCPRE